MSDADEEYIEEFRKTAGAVADKIRNSFKDFPDDIMGAAFTHLLACAVADRTGEDYEEIEEALGDFLGRYIKELQ